MWFIEALVIALVIYAIVRAFHGKDEPWDYPHK